MTKIKSPKTTKRSRSAVVSDRTFEMIMDRFDANDALTKNLHTVLERHIKDDNTTRDMVNKHSTYWGLLTTTMLVASASVTAWINKWI
jgi:hypothetical protein